MLKLGCHLSVSNGYYKAGLEAVELGANTFQFFTRNPRGGSAKALDMEDLDALARVMKNHDFAYLFAHGSYTMNLCSDKADTRTYAKEIFIDDLRRLSLIPNALYVFHPGSHVKQGVEQGITYIVDALNDAITADNQVKICLEGMAGKGTEIGRTFEELKRIIDGVRHSEKLGVCLDTCHLYSSGYDVVNNLDQVIEDFDRIIGLEKLYAVHLNDSKTPFASQKDRHEKIGEGTIGIQGLIRIISHPKLRHLPFNLETPNENEGYQGEIKMLREAYKAVVHHD